MVKRESTTLMFNFIIMTFIQRIECMQRLHQLIQRRATGTPAQLAIKLEVSESTVYALLAEAKELGALFRYNRTIQSYEYLHQTQFQIGFSSLESIKITGGSLLFSLLRKIRSGPKYICEASQTSRPDEIDCPGSRKGSCFLKRVGFTK